MRVRTLFTTYMENNMEKMKMGFAAIGKEWKAYIPEPTVVETRGRSYCSWGDDNAYPQYLHGLYDDVATLKGIIDATAEYAAGNDAEIQMEGFGDVINSRGDSVRDMIELLAKDYLLYGGFAIQVIRDNIGNIRDLYWMDFKNVRTDKDGNVIWYSEDFDKKWARADKMIQYPRFNRLSKDPSSVLYVKNTFTDVYPTPRYSGAIRACEIQRAIDHFHLASLKNGFAGSYLLNFANGLPTDQEREQIEKDITEKFCGADNGGQILISYSDGKDNGLTLQRMEISDFGNKYQAASDRSRQEIFTAFRCIPLLVGLTAESNTGFSTQEYSDSFKLYNRGVVRPIQMKIADTFDKIFNTKGALVIEPFSLEENKEENVDNSQQVDNNIDNI